ncbi:MAG: hypothetical protein IK954_02115 [Clostridia bacterium]|nr:hypothetical protein [Clostridia bacterium]
MRKKAVIFGDSYSTFKGFVPEGYSVYYSEIPRPETDVTKLSETWWHQVASAMDLDVVLNDSWSGATIGYTSYNGVDCSQTSSFICRLRRLIDQGYFEGQAVDTVFIFGGTNDSWSDAPLGCLTEGIDEQALYSVLPAIGYFLTLLRETLPQAMIYCIINDELKPEIADTMKAVCLQHGIIAVTLEGIDKRCGHPTVKGMKAIADTVLQTMK